MILCVSLNANDVFKWFTVGFELLLPALFY